MSGLGRRRWAIPGGHIPLRSTGREPELTSRDELSLLNVGEQDAQTELTIYFADRDPVGPYRLKVPARRVRRVRINDLIDPEAVPLATDYAGTVVSDVPVVVQFSRQDTGFAARASAGTIAYPIDSDGRHREQENTTMSAPIGRKRWAIAEGYIPGWSNGPEPELASHESVCLLNTSDQEARVELTVYFTDREPAGPYRVTVPARRTKHVRLNELTDPEPIPIATTFASVIEADVPIVVQHTRLDSRQAENALLSTIAYAANA